MLWFTHPCGLHLWLFCSGNVELAQDAPLSDRKSTRLNSSHLVISYAVFCLKKKIIDLYDVHVPALTRVMQFALGVPPADAAPQGTLRDSQLERPPASGQPPDRPRTHYHPAHA